THTEKCSSSDDICTLRCYRKSRRPGLCNRPLPHQTTSSTKPTNPIPLRDPIRDPDDSTARDDHASLRNPHVSLSRVVEEDRLVRLPDDVVDRECVRVSL